MVPGDYSPLASPYPDPRTYEYDRNGTTDGACGPQVQDRERSFDPVNSNFNYYILISNLNFVVPKAWILRGSIL